MFRFCIFVALMTDALDTRNKDHTDQDSFVGHRICGRARTCEKKRRYPSDISSFSHLIESTRRRRTSGGRSPATTGAERRHSNRSSPAGLEHRNKSHPSDDSFFYLFESTRRDSNPRPSPWQGDTPPLSHSCIGNIPSKPHIELHQPLNLHLTFLDKPSTD